LTNGDVLAAFHTNEDGNDDIKVVRSIDHGYTWGVKKTVYKTSALERWPVIMQLSNGDVLSVFATQEGGNWNITLRRSLDDGYTWGGKVIMYSGPGLELGPSIIQVVNGNLLTAFETNEDGTWDSKSIGDTQDSLVPGLRRFVTEVDLRPAKDLIVRINASLDTNTGLLTWRFISVQPQDCPQMTR
jgi:hypothetical protein